MSTHPSPKDAQRKFALASVRDRRQQLLTSLQQTKRSEKTEAKREQAEADLATIRREEMLQSEIDDIDLELMLQEAENM